MIRRLSTRYATIALVAIAVLGTAKLAVQAQTPSPNAILVAKQIVEIKGIKDLFGPIARGVVEKAKATLLQTNYMWSKDIDEITANLHKDYDSRSSEIVDAVAQIYASHFTEAELKTLLTFYKSPVGQKMLTEEPKVTDESMVDAAKWADNLSGDVMAKMRVEMKKRGHDL